MADVIPTFSSAASSAIAYIYQFRLALHLLVREAERPLLDEDLLGASIELFDDVGIHYDGESISFVQSKSHLDPAKTLTDSHVDLWKTLRIWIDAMKARGWSAQRSHLLFTTSSVVEGSAVHFLRDSNSRDAKTTVAKLDAIAKTSKAALLADAFIAWNSLTDDQKQSLAGSIYVLDGSPDALELYEDLGRRLFRHKSHADQLIMMEQLEGWWINRVASHLYAIARDRREDMIRWTEVRTCLDKILADFGLDVLPNEYGGLTPDFPINPANDPRLFVQQMRFVDVSDARMCFAIRDHWRASEQRSKWVRDLRLLPSELVNYNRLLVEEWERTSDDHCSAVDVNDVAASKAAGQKVLRAVEQQQISLRSFTDAFLTRGSFHILADDPPKIGWHPNWKNVCSISPEGQGT